MPAARDLGELRWRLDRFFWHNASPHYLSLRRILATHFEPFGEVGVVGGLVRDFAREGRSGFRSDVDLVIAAPEAEVATLAMRLRARRNTYGGYSHVAPGWKVDFWALESTWASTAGHVTVRSFDDVLRCTFFDWDSVFYHLTSRTLICRADYVETVRSRKLEINLRSNPMLRANLIRAVRRIIMWDVSPGPSLARFIVDGLTQRDFPDVKAEEARTYTDPVMSRYRDSSRLLARLMRDVDATGRGTVWPPRPAAPVVHRDEHRTWTSTPVPSDKDQTSPMSGITWYRSGRAPSTVQAAVVPGIRGGGRADGLVAPAPLTPWRCAVRQRAVLVNYLAGGTLPRTSMDRPAQLRCVAASRPPLTGVEQLTALRAPEPDCGARVIHQPPLPDPDRHGKCADHQIAETAQVAGRGVVPGRPRAVT